MKPDFSKVADDSAVEFKNLMGEASEALAQAWEQLREEVQESDTSCVMRIGFTISIDPSEKQVGHRLSFATRRRFESTIPLEDPDQPELPINGGGDPFATDDPPGIKRKKTRGK
jgi:hypothetical protein